MNCSQESQPISSFGEEPICCFGANPASKHNLQMVSVFLHLCKDKDGFPGVGAGPPGIEPTALPTCGVELTLPVPQAGTAPIPVLPTVEPKVVGITV